MPEPLTGACLCGAIRYSAGTDQTLHYICHCTDCRRYAGTPYHAGIVVAAEALQVDGTPTVWTMTAESGRTIARHYCAGCGGHLFTSPWPDPARYSIKAGTLDTPEAFRPRHEIWTQSRVSWADRPPDIEAHAQGFPGPLGIGQPSADTT